MLPREHYLKQAFLDSVHFPNGFEKGGLSDIQARLVRKNGTLITALCIDEVSDPTTEDLHILKVIANQSSPKNPVEQAWVKYLSLVKGMAATMPKGKGKAKTAKPAVEEPAPEPVKPAAKAEKPAKAPIAAKAPAKAATKKIEAAPAETKPAAKKEKAEPVAVKAKTAAKKAEPQKKTEPPKKVEASKKTEASKKIEPPKKAAKKAEPKKAEPKKPEPKKAAPKKAEPKVEAKKPAAKKSH